MLNFCRYLALLYAIGLGIGEAVINSSQAHWQFAPLWIIDYIIVVYLLIGFWLTRRGRNIPILMSAYALSTGVLYLAFFLNLDPDAPEGTQERGVVFVLMGLILGVSVVGLAASTLAWYRLERDHRRAPAHR